MKYELDKQARDKIIDIRRRIHQNPELAFNEYKTSQTVAEFLTELGLEPQTGISTTGITAVIRGGGSGKTLLLRADMDALPIAEQTALPYASKNNGIMHACGHDIHISILLAAAVIINNIRNRLNGNVKLVFQPAEESTGGAQPMIEAGILKNPEVDAAFAYHITDAVPTGSVTVMSGGAMASPDHFFIHIHGKGGHGAMPELCKNPVDIGSELVTKFKKISCNERFVISICSFVCGTSDNIISDNALLKGTARSLDPKTRQYIYRRICSIIKATEKKYGVEIELDYHFLYPPLVNDKKITELFIKTAADALGADKVVIQKKADMIGEDFAFFAQAVPSCMAKLGGAVAPLHSPHFTADEDAIFIGASLMAEFSENFLNNQL